MSTFLAVNGGKPLLARGEYLLPAWPPRDEATAEKIKELYLSGKWSFNSETEQEFERAFAECHDAKHAIFMVNGTVTLECALAALGVGPGDEVIVPGLTWLATAMSAVYVGATPVFADIDPATCCLSPEAFEKAITPKTKAVIPVHLYGSMADLEQILAIAEKHHIAVVEDCAHMQGGKWAGRGVGSWGAVGSFSFQQSKTLTSGEGGICITNDDELAERIFRVKHIGYARCDSQGAAKSGPPSDLICHNYRGLAFPALILKEQLGSLADQIARYNEFAKRLRAAIAEIPGVRLQQPGRLASPQGYYAMQIIFDNAVWGVAARVGQALQAEGIPVSGGNYGPVYRHMLFTTKRYRNTGCPVAEEIGTQGLSIPHRSMFHPEMADNFAAAVEKVYRYRSEL